MYTNITDVLWIDLLIKDYDDGDDDDHHHNIR